MLTLYILSTFALIIKPGPDIMCTIATALSDGRVAAARFMCGLMAGSWIWFCLLAAGVAPFFSSHPRIVFTIQLAGVFYMAYLAFLSFRECFAGKSGAIDVKRIDNVDNAVKSRSSYIIRGIAMSMSNPLLILFLMAFLPSFIGETDHVAFKTLFLGAIFIIVIPCVHIPAILASEWIKKHFETAGRGGRRIKFVSGIVLLLAALLVFAKALSTVR